MIDADETHKALQKLMRCESHDQDNPDWKPTVANIDRELNEACHLTGAARIDVRGSLDVLRTRGWVVEVGGEWRLRVAEETRSEQGTLFG